MLTLASILAWVWGVLLLLSALALGIPSVSRGASLVLPIVLIGLGTLLCIAGAGLRKRRRRAGLIALVASGLLCILYAVVFAPLSLIGIVVNLGIIGAVAVNWKRLS